MESMTITNGDIILEFIYLISALFFVVGLKLLSSPDSARRGNLWAAAGMIMAMIATMIFHRDGAGESIKGANLVIILAAIALGGVVGALIARRIKMTAMPQLVSFFNATGGAASALVALIEFSNPENQSALVTLLGLVIGSIAFSGSMIAYGKLNGNIKDIFTKWLTYINLLILAGIVVLVVLLLGSGMHGAKQPNAPVSVAGCFPALRCEFCNAHWWCRHAGCYFAAQQLYRDRSSHGWFHIPEPGHDPWGYFCRCCRNDPYPADV